GAVPGGRFPGAGGWPRGAAVVTVSVIGSLWTRSFPTAMRSAGITIVPSPLGMSRKTVVEVRVTRPFRIERFWAVPPRSTSTPAITGAPTSGRFSPSNPTSTVSVAMPPGAIRFGAIRASIESFPLGEVLPSADSTKKRSASLLPVTVSVLLARLPLLLLPAGPALRLQGFEPALGFLLGEGARASPGRRRGRGAARAGARLRALVPPRRLRSPASRRRVLPVFGIRLPQLPQGLLEIPLGVGVPRPEAKRFPVGARRAPVVLAPHGEVAEVVERRLAGRLAAQARRLPKPDRRGVRRPAAQMRQALVIRDDRGPGEIGASTLEISERLVVLLLLELAHAAPRGPAPFVEGAAREQDEQREQDASSQRRLLRGTSRSPIRRIPANAANQGNRSS